jgi:hypothetical protein
VTMARRGSVDVADRNPGIRVGIVSPAVSQDGPALKTSTPNDHFNASPDGCGILSRTRSVCRGGCDPTIGTRIISTASLYVAAPLSSTPNDHLTPGPNCRVEGLPVGRRSSGNPGVRARIISATAVLIGPSRALLERAVAAPDDHFAASPNCGV